MTYLVFRCSRCGRHLYAERGTKTRTCSCKKRIQLDKVRILAEADDARVAGEAVRQLQLGDHGLTGFEPMKSDR
jgi:hypothetical protein